VKILVGINSLGSGGAEVFASELAVAYAKMGHNVLFLIYAGILDNKGQTLYNELLTNNVQVVDLSSKSKVVLLFYYFYIVKTFRPKLIHSNLEQSDMLLGLTKVFNRSCSYIRTLHNVKVFDRIPLILYKLLFNLYDKNIGCSNYVKTHFEIAKLRKKIFAIPNGVDIERIRLRNINYTKEQCVFLVIGTSMKRFGEYQKGHDLIFKAFDSIKANYKVIFIGDTKNVPHDFPEAFSNPNFTFQGIVSDVTEYLLSADYLLAPSRFEGLPISVIEGVCSGLPLICSDIEGFIPFKNNSTLKVKSGDENDLRAKIEYAVRNRVTFSKLGVEHATLYREQFSIKEVAKRYLNLF